MSAANRIHDKDDRWRQITLSGQKMAVVGLNAFAEDYVCNGGSSGQHRGPERNSVVRAWEGAVVGDEVGAKDCVCEGRSSEK